MNSDLPHWISKAIRSRIRVDADHWIWTGSFSFAPVFGRTNVRREVIEQSGVALLVGEFVMVDCGHPRCVRPDHMRVGTEAERNAKARAARRVR